MHKVVILLCKLEILGDAEVRSREICDLHPFALSAELRVID